MSHEDLDARLSRLAAATSAVGPRAGFSERVMARIDRERPNGWLSLGAPARRFLPFGLLVAAVSLVWAVSVNGQVNEALATGDDTELAW